MSNKRYLMTWNAKSKRWFKKYKKKQYSVGISKLRKMFPDVVIEATKESSGPFANQWWLNKDLDKPAASEIREVRMRKPGSVGKLVERFLELQLAKVHRGQRAVGTYDRIRKNLEHFVDFFGAKRRLRTIDAALYYEYFCFLEREMTLERLAPSTARDRISEARRLIRHAWRMNLLDEIPRNLDDPELAIEVPINEVKTFEPDELRRLFDASSEREQLYWLLMLNTGMTQKDVSDLLHEEVDWEKGTITRKRSKAKKYINAPVVTYRLWPKTFRLLITFCEPDFECVLMSKSYQRLLHVRLRESDNKLQKTDAIKNAFDRVAKNAEIEGKTIKLFRKTSATLLAEEYSDSLASQFLGHSPSGVASRHYIRPSQKRLNKALKWLGKTLAPHLRFDRDES